MTRNCVTFVDCLDFADSIDRMRQEVGPSLKKSAVGQNNNNSGNGKWQSQNKGDSSNGASNSSRPERPTGITDKTNPEYGLQKFNSRNMNVNDTTCYRCKKKGHLARYCPGNYDQGKPKQKTGLAVSDEKSEEVETPKNKVGCTFEIIRSPIACIPILMNNVKTHACDDHGSSLTFVDKKIIDPIDLVKLRPWTGGSIGMVNGTSFVPIGEIENVKISIGSCETVMKVAVIENNMVPVLLGDDFRRLCKLKITCFEGKRCYQKQKVDGSFECVVQDHLAQGCSVFSRDEESEKYYGPKGLRGRDAYREFAKRSKANKVEFNDVANASGRIGVMHEMLLKQKQYQGTAMAVSNSEINEAADKAVMMHTQEEYDALLGACGFSWDAKDGKFH